MDEADELSEALAFMHRGRLVAQGTPASLKRQQGEGATLDEVFIRLTGASIVEPEDYRDVARLRHTFKRLE